MRIARWDRRPDCSIAYAAGFETDWPDSYRGVMPSISGIRRPRSYSFEESVAHSRLWVRARINNVDGAYRQYATAIKQPREFEKG